MSSSDATFLPEEVIRKKRDRQPLTAHELKLFVDGTVSGAVSQGQIGAFTMAVYLNGMSREERIAYTLAMRDSGKVIDWSEIGLTGPTIIDKHSSGGVGDEKVSLIVAPLVAACGIHMPMISARGLGHTGGEIDLLDCIPGYDFTPPSDTFMRVVKDIGCAIIGPTPDLAPADRPIFYVRDVSATVESIPLITGSIMSKKLAAGINGLVMTVPFGSGAFMKNEAEARTLAESLIEVATGAKVPMVALISDLTQVLGDSVGNNLQILEIIAFLTGEFREARLLETVLALAAEILLMGGIEPTNEAARATALRRLDDGSATDRFARMVAAFGGPADLVQAPDRYLAHAPMVQPVYADQGGFVGDMDCFAIGMAMVSLGAGRTLPDQQLDHAVGLSGMTQTGSAIGPDRPICFVHARSVQAWDSAATAIRGAVKIRPEIPVEQPVIRGRLAGP